VEIFWLSIAKKFLKIDEYLAELKQEGGCHVHSVSLASTLLRVEEYTRHSSPFCP